MHPRPVACGAFQDPGNDGSEYWRTTGPISLQSQQTYIPRKSEASSFLAAPSLEFLRRFANHSSQKDLQLSGRILHRNLVAIRFPVTCPQLRTYRIPGISSVYGARTLGYRPPGRSMT